MRRAWKQRVKLVLYEETLNVHAADGTAFFHVFEARMANAGMPTGEEGVTGGLIQADHAFGLIKYGLYGNHGTRFEAEILLENAGLNTASVQVVDGVQLGGQSWMRYDRH